MLACFWGGRGQVSITFFLSFLSFIILSLLIKMKWKCSLQSDMEGGCNQTFTSSSTLHQSLIWMGNIFLIFYKLIWKHCIKNFIPIRLFSIGHQYRNLGTSTFRDHQMENNHCFFLTKAWDLLKQQVGSFLLLTAGLRRFTVLSLL